MERGPVGHVLALPGRERVDDGDLVAAGDERVHDVGADEAGAACHHRAHGRILWTARDAARGTSIARSDRGRRHALSDAACPWAYSANPALRVLEWRYREQLTWRLVLIGLREDASALIARGYDPARAVLGHHTFRERYGMPFGLVPKERPAGTGRGCRAIVAARLLDSRK